MAQFIFFALLIITLLAGTFAYFAPLRNKTIAPMKFVMDNSGINPVETYNRKRTQQLNMTTREGLVQISKRMNDLSREQNEFFDTVQNQQQVLRDTGQDLLQLNALTTQMQNQQRLLVAHGQDLIVLNDQLTQNRQWIADQINLVNTNNEASLSALQQRYVMLKDQAASFFDKVAQHNQEVRDQMNKIQDHLRDLANNAAYDSTMQQQSIRERIHRMLEKEHEDMLKLADSEQRSKDLLEEERQRARDQQWINQQRAADQEQRMQDEQNR